MSGGVQTGGGMRSERGLPALITLAVLLALLAWIPSTGETYYIKLAMKIMAFAILAMSLDLLVGFTGLVSFGHAAYFGLAAYMIQILSPEYEAGNLWTVVPAAIAVTACVAAVIGAMVVRTGGVYFIMATLAFAQMLFYFFHDSKVAGGSDGAYIFVKPYGDLGFAAIDLDDRGQLYWFGLAVLVATYAALRVILASPFGHVIRGIRANEHRMRALGYGTYWYKLAAFVIAAAFAGAGGIVFGLIDGFIAPEMLGWPISGFALVIIILGGIGTLHGAIIGAVVITVVEDIFRDRAIVGDAAGHWQILMGLFVIAVVMFLPRGIAGLLDRRGAR